MDIDDCDPELRNRLNKALEENARLRAANAKMELDKRIFTLLLLGKSHDDVAQALNILARRVVIAIETDYGKGAK
jgi:hypothetical protein